MDRSYKIKLEEKIKGKTLNEYIIASCILPYQKRINKLKYNRAIYKNSSFELPDKDGSIKAYYYEERTVPIRELNDYIRPFLFVLASKYFMTPDEIRETISNVRNKDVPTREMIAQIRNIIVSGKCSYEYL